MAADYTRDGAAAAMRAPAAGDRPNLGDPSAVGTKA